jgi:glycosyltransferase involved in cell wall biosynthesis
MIKPAVSVIIPTYNREKLLPKALESIKKQTFQDFEIVIIDDASTDGTESYIKGLNDSRIKYYKLDKNSGQCVARNYGIKRANGEFIAFLDSDDEWLPEKLKKQYDCFRKGPQKLGSVYCYPYSKDVIKDKTSLNRSPYYRGDIYKKFLEGFCPSTPSLFMIKKEALEKVNYFDEKLITFVDLDLHIRVSKEYLFDYVDEPLIIKYEQIGDQYVNNFDKRYNGYFLFMNKWRNEVLKTNGPEGLLSLKRHLVHSIAFPMLTHPPKNLRKNIFKLIKLLMDVRSPRTKFYIKAFLIFIFGRGIIYTLRKKGKKPIVQS